MKRVLACCSALIVLAGCVTRSEWREVPATMRLLDNPPGNGELTLTLKDGRVEHLDRPSDYGSALCDPTGCVQKQDVAMIKYLDSNVDIGASAVATPLLVGVGGIIVLACLFGCNPTIKDNGVAAPAGDRATPEEIGRQWLDGLAIQAGVVVYRGVASPCAAAAPLGAGQAFASDDEALAWIAQHRNAIGLDCLNAAYSRLNTLDGAGGVTHRDARMALYATQRVRVGWDWARCESGPPYAPWVERIGPSPEFDLKPRKGDPAQLKLLEQTLADPASYDHAGDLEKICQGKIRAREQWPDPLAWGSARGPFSPRLPPKGSSEAG